MLLLRFLWETISRYHGPRSNSENDISLVPWITSQVLPCGWTLCAMTQQGHCFFENACSVYTIRTLNRSVFLNFYILPFFSIRDQTQSLIHAPYSELWPLFLLLFLFTYLFINDRMTTQHSRLLLTYLSGTTYYNYILSAFPLPVLSKV